MQPAIVSAIPYAPPICKSFVARAVSKGNYPLPLSTKFKANTYIKYLISMHNQWVKWLKQSEKWPRKFILKIQYL